MCFLMVDVTATATLYIRRRRFVAGDGASSPIPPLNRFCQTEALKTEPTIEQDVDDDDEDRTYVRPVVVIVTASDQQKKEKTVRTHAHSLTLLPARSSSRPPAGSRWKIKSNPTRRSNGSPEATETPAMFSPRTYVFGADLVSQSFNQLF
jgi:hypothetical protein